MKPLGSSIYGLAKYTLRAFCKEYVKLTEDNAKSSDGFSSRLPQCWVNFLLSSYFTPPPPVRVTLAPLSLSLCLSTLCIKGISIPSFAHLYSLSSRGGGGGDADWTQRNRIMKKTVFKG